jgi:hypothetical protein
MVQETGQPYAYTGDDPVNGVDPSGLAAGHLSPDAACQRFRDKSTCEAEIQSELGGVPCSDHALASQTGPEALFLALTVATGGVGDLLELLGTSDAESGLLARLTSQLGDETGAASLPFRTPWGWSGSASYRAAVGAVDQGATIEDVGGIVPTQSEAEQLIEDGGGTVQRIENAHEPPNPHQYPHINYTTSAGIRGTIQIQEVQP